MPFVALLLSVFAAPAPELPTPNVLPLLQDAAIALEIMDGRERTYLFNRLESFPDDAQTMLRRWRDLKDAPPLADAARFPQRDIVTALLEFNRAYRENLAGRMANEPLNVWELHEAIVETDAAYTLWDNVRDSQQSCYYVTVRRLALKKVRDDLGYADYYSGRLPPHVPVWRFARADR